MAWIEDAEQGRYWCAKLSANLIRCFWISTRFNSPKASTRSAATDYEVKLHGEFSFKFDLPVG